MLVHTRISFAKFNFFRNRWCIRYDRKKEGCHIVGGNIPLELTVKDVVQKINEFDHTKRFFDKLYSLCPASPKNHYEQTESYHSLSFRLNVIGHVLEVRWIAPSARSVQAVWNDYKTLISDF
jgi:hypothetical protein